MILEILISLLASGLGCYGQK